MAMKRHGEEEVDMVEKILVLGGHKDWNRLRKSNAPALTSALYRIGPVEIWNRMLYGTLTSAMGGKEIPEDMGGIVLPEPTSRTKGGTKCSDWTYSEDGSGRAGGKRGVRNHSLTELGVTMDKDDIDERSGDTEFGVSDVRDFFRIRNEVVYGSGKVDDLLSGVAESTRSAYQTAWTHWAHFTASHSEGVWIEEHKPKWDGRLIDWILFEARILGNQVGTIRSKISAIRYWNILSGYPDFAKWSGRYKQVLKSITRKDAVKRNYPFNLELLHLADLELGTAGERIKENKAIYATLAMGFFFLFRMKEMENLRMCDVSLGRKDGCTFLDVFLVGSKTDQYNQGDRKRLMEIGGNLCPVNALVRWLEVCGRNPKSREKLLPRTFGQP